MNKELKEDLYRINGKNITTFEFIKAFLLHHEIRFLYFYRNDTNFLKHFILRKIRTKYGLEIFSKNIGGGLFIAHPYMITINSKVIIGRNCNLNKGCTIGEEFRGERKGTPIIGNNVWIGANSTIVGKITIGNNVLIAPNTFVNKDIPENSIVFGNPCIVKSKKTAVDGYINNIYECNKEGNKNER